MNGECLNCAKQRLELDGWRDSYWSLMVEHQRLLRILEVVVEVAMKPIYVVQGDKPVEVETRFKGTKDV